jgi:hypothetical protein
VFLGLILPLVFYIIFHDLPQKTPSFFLSPVNVNVFSFYKCRIKKWGTSLIHEKGAFRWYDLNETLLNITGSTGGPKS